MKTATVHNVLDKKILCGKIKKDELFRFMKALHVQCDSLKAVKGSRKVRQAGSKKTACRSGQTQMPHELLRRYFAQRMTQISGAVR